MEFIKQFDALKTQAHNTINRIVKEKFNKGITSININESYTDDEGVEITIVGIEYSEKYGISIKNEYNDSIPLHFLQAETVLSIADFLLRYNK